MHSFSASTIITLLFVTVIGHLSRQTHALDFRNHGRRSSASVPPTFAIDKVTGSGRTRNRHIGSNATSQITNIPVGGAGVVGKRIIAALPKGWGTRKRIETYIHRLFNEADSNKDGTVSLDEVYTLVLKLYVKLNRNAPVEPPSEQTVLTLFGKADQNKNNRLDNDEFLQLMLVIYGRAAVRVAIHKALRLFVAPLLAMQSAAYVTNSPVTTFIADWVPDRLGGMLRSEKFWTTSLVVFFMSTLGNILMGLTVCALDMLNFNQKTC